MQALTGGNLNSDIFCNMLLFVINPSNTCDKFSPEFLSRWVISDSQPPALSSSDSESISDSDSDHWLILSCDNDIS